MRSEKGVVNVLRNPSGVEVIVDASNHVVGRLATVVARWLLQGRKVVIVNAEKAVITGDFNMVLNWYKKKISEWKTHYNPEKTGPKIPRRPDRILKRIIRGMLPRKKWRGRKALKRLRVYIGTPQECVNKPKVVVVKALIRERSGAKYTTLEELWSNLESNAYKKWREAIRIWSTFLTKGGHGE